MHLCECWCNEWNAVAPPYLRFDLKMHPERKKMVALLKKKDIDCGCVGGGSLV